MGKKGKKKSNNSSSSAAASKSEKEQKRQARLSLVDEQGRMHREDGIRFYGLLDFIVLSCIGDIEKERRVSPNVPPLNWPERDGLQKMPDAVRSIVMSYVLRNIDRLSAEVDLGVHDELFLKCFSRSIEEKDKDDIRSWKNHIFDDFIVVDHIAHKGTVLVQVGRVQQVEGEEELHSTRSENDNHPPRVFIIQGISTPIEELFMPITKKMMTDSPSFKVYQMPIAIINTTILPYQGGLTYGVVYNSQEQKKYYHTPQQYAEAVRIACDAYKETVLNQEMSASSSCAKLYDSVTPEIVRLTKNEFKQDLDEETKLLNAASYATLRNNPAVNQVFVASTFWLPFHNIPPTDTRQIQVIEEILLGGRPLNTIHEGFKHMNRAELLVHDDDPCPIHRRIGGTVALPFAQCCKREHIKRIMKARKRGDVELRSATYFYNPVDEEENEYVDRYLDQSFRQNILDKVRIAPLDSSDVRLRVPLSSVDEVKMRMDSSELFISINPPGSRYVELRWTFISCLPVTVFGGGILVFGDVSLNTQTGDFIGEAITEERCAALIRHMKDVCAFPPSIPVEDVHLVGQVVGKTKPNKKALLRNDEMLAEEFQTNTSVEIDKETHRNRTCEYCGKTEKDGFKLLRCACKKYYYCCKEHQVANWKDHKATCIQIRKG